MTHKSKITENDLFVASWIKENTSRATITEKRCIGLYVLLKLRNKSNTYTSDDLTREISKISSLVHKSRGLNPLAITLDKPIP